jgi:spore maturation protein CgeB
MRFVMFYHSLVSDWNHGNAHFLRGVCTELLASGHEVVVYEPKGGWSLDNLRRDHGDKPLTAFKRRYPQLSTTFYECDSLQLDKVLEGADVVLVHEWNSPELVRAIGKHRRSHDYQLLFHDTHHRAVTAPHQMAQYDLSHYDGVLAFGTMLRDLYLQKRWTDRAWTWHEAADTRLFQPLPDRTPRGDLVWIGNWGDEERSEELRTCLIEPVKQLRLRASVYGVRYPAAALRTLRQAGIEYGGWLPNFDAPEVFSRYRVTVHIPRRPYRESISGIPTIRVFEALACGIPLVCLHWHDSEGLFTPDNDYLLAKTPAEMTQRVRDILHDPALSQQLAQHGLRTIAARHTCAHRVDELLTICQELCGEGRPGTDRPRASSQLQKSSRPQATSAPASR